MLDDCAELEQDCRFGVQYPVDLQSPRPGKSMER